MELKIYNQSEELKLTVSTSSSSTWNMELMTENAISVSFTHPFYVPLDVNDYVLLSGVKFSINKEYKPKQKSTQEYTYSVKFYGPEHDAQRVMYLNLTDGQYDVQFSLDGSPREHLKKWVDNMNRIYGREVWSMGDVVVAANQTIEYNNSSCWDALAFIAEAFETEWWADGFTINLSRCERGERISLGYMQGLTSLTQSENSNDVKFFTRLIPLGSTKNIDRSRYGYSRLQLPDKSTYVDRNTQYGLYEYVEEAAFAEIFPHYTGTVSSVRSEEKTGEDKKPFTIYYFKDNGMTFDPSSKDNEISGLVKHVSFQTGDLAGRDFEANYNSATKEWEIINIYPDEETQIPGGNLIPRVGNTYIPWNFRMPAEYETQAEQDYKAAVDNYLKKYSEDVSKYGGDTDYIYIDTHNVPLQLGQSVRLTSDEYFGEVGYRDSRMTKVVRKLDNLSIATIECSNQVGKGWKTQVDNSLSELKYVIGQKEETVLDVLKSWDGRDITDYRVLSGLRTLKEIKQRALSRLENDEAAGHIKFKKGETVENGLIVRLPKQDTPAALMSCLLEEDIDTLIEEDEDAIVEIAPAEASGDLTLGGLLNADSSFDSLPNDVYSLEMRDGTFYPKIGGGLVIGTDPGTAYDGAAGATLEQMVRELAGGAGTMYSVYIRNNMPSLGFAAQYGEECILDFTFISQYRDDLNEPYKPTGELGLCTVMVKNAKFADFTVVKQMEVSSGVSIKQDIAEWLTSGSNNIKITTKGLNTDQTTAPVTYTVQLTSLGISAPNFAWWTAFAGDITIPMIINGNINKTLNITITGDDYNQSYTRNLGTAIYTDTPYNYVLPHPGATGVYNVSFYLSNSDNTIQTKAVSVNIMCISAGETSKLMCVNNVAALLTNWQDNVVFDYAIYDGQSAATDAIFSITKDGIEVYSSENDNIATNTRNTLTYPMEVDTDDDANFDVVVNVTSEKVHLIEPVTLNVNNSLGYSATAGAVLYINPKTRSNSQTNYLSVVNEADKSLIPVTWSNLNWGNDGWVTDDDGVKTLKIFARSKAVIDYQPFITEAARKGKTIEIDFKVENASDAGKDIISIAEDKTDGSRVGLKVSGENVSFFSQSMHDNSTQDVPIDNGVRIRLTVVVMPNAYGDPDFNLVAIYINGKKNRQYAYLINDYFRNTGKIILGNDYANLYLYGLRIYDSALTSEAVQKNYINQLATTDEKQTEKSVNQVLDGEGVNIDFNATKLLYNVFVIDQPFPNLNNPSGVAGNLEVFFKDKPERNFTLTNLLVEGQGTSSKKYLEWNIRFKLKGLKDAEGNKIASIATYADGTTDKNKVLMFDGVPKSGRLTAKKNWASSMQDHKAGCVDAYDALYKEMGMKNEAMVVDPKIRVAVYQEPFIGFSKSVNEEGQDVYTCMGEFTFGPDKGDDLCFGYDTEAFPELLSVEGSDNAPLGALFRVPWNRSKSYWAYNPDEEAFQYNDTNCWDFDAGELNADETEPLSAQKWIDAYNAVYVCSNRIRPFNGTLDDLNAQITTYRGTGYEYWIAKAGDANLYNLYYYEAAEGRFIPSDIGAGQINLKTQLKDYLTADLSVFTADQLNELFVNARKQLFRATIPALFDIDDAVFHYCFTEFTAGTDQRAKNTYPYNFCTVGSKWRWRLDDADTIFPIDNQGQDRKPYHCEMHDSYDNGQPIWNGETSTFWNMLELAFNAEIIAGMRKMLNAMEALCGQSSGTPYDKVYAFYRKFYLGVKNYFPATLVNADAKRYELAKIAYDKGQYTNDTDPITQSHGDFYSAETAWVKKRIMYIMSKYSYGLFSADGTDTIIVRAAGDLIDYEITPAFDMYPAIANGTSIVRGERTKAGAPCKITIDLGGSADQQNAIQAASWLLSIGDWHKKNVSGTMVVRGRRLTELILGSKIEDVIISITGLTLADCGSMQKILLSNIATLQGTLDLSAIINIREIYADGTSLSQIKLPNGGGLEVIEYPANNKYISFRNFPVLTTEGLRIGQCAVNITDFWIENCPLLKPVQLLSDIIEAQQSQGIAHVLKHVRAVGFEEEYYTADALDMLAKLTDGTYEGLDSSGLAGEEPIPVLDGKITVHSNYYQDSVDSLRGIFNKLKLVMDGTPAIRFEDPEVLRILTTGKAYINDNGSNIGLLMPIDEDGDEMIIPEEINNVKSLSNRPDRNNSIFTGNTVIETFNEFQFFTGLNKINIGSFDGCTNLREVTLPPNTILGNSSFSQTSISRLIIPEGYQIIGKSVFQRCPNLILVDFPSTITSISDGGSLFWYMRNQVVVICRALTPPILGGWGYEGEPKAIYVPDASVDAYKSADVWSSQAAKIQPLSAYL